MAVAIVVSLGACTAGDPGVTARTGRSPGAATTGTAGAATDFRTDPPAATGSLQGALLVSAASSLTDAFAEIETAFESAHPGVDVTRNHAGSSTLREQLLDGAPADVFAAADTTTMDDVVESGLVATLPRAFATNRLAIAVPPGNPGGVTDLGDFDDGERFLGLCAREVPCGRFAGQALEAAGITPDVDTREGDVRALLAKVEVGELDAGITYVSDIATSDGRVEGVAIPERFEVVAEYPIAALADAADPRLADAFVAFVLAEGQSLLADAGFGPP